MEDMLPHLAAPSAWVRAHMGTISSAITTTLLVIFGDDINRFVKRRIRGYHFILRTGAFVLLCAVGYGMLSVAGAPAVSRVLRYFGDQYLALSVPAAFVVMGVLAERKKYM